MILSKTTDLSALQARLTAQSMLRREVEAQGHAFSTGRHHDPVTQLQADLPRAAQITGRLAVLSADQNAGTETRDHMAILQVSIDRLSTLATEVSGDLFLQSEPGSPGPDAAALRAAFAEAVGVVRGQAAGRGLFSGQETRAAALPDADTLLGLIGTATAAATTASDLEDALDDWFDVSPTGYSAVVVPGDPALRAELPDGQGGVMQIPVTAADPEIRDLLKSLAKAVFAVEKANSIPGSESQALVRSAGEELATGVSRFAQLSGSIGALEERVETGLSRAATESAALSLQVSELLSADPYEAATRLENAAATLERVYAVTARSSALSLANYLR